LLAIVRDDDVCRRLMTTPGVGPVVALTYRATVDVPARFRNSKAVGAVFGLTPSQHQSGEIDRIGSISKCGDAMMRTMLFEAAQAMLMRSAKWSWLKARAMKIARHRGMKKAIMAGTSIDGAYQSLCHRTKSESEPKRDPPFRLPRRFRTVCNSFTGTGCGFFLTVRIIRQGEIVRLRNQG
jgi:hypothetical protein